VGLKPRDRPRVRPAFRSTQWMALTWESNELEMKNKRVYSYCYLRGGSALAKKVSNDVLW